MVYIVNGMSQTDTELDIVGHLFYPYIAAGGVCPAVSLLSGLGCLSKPVDVNKASHYILSVITRFSPRIDWIFPGEALNPFFGAQDEGFSEFRSR